MGNAFWQIMRGTEQFGIRLTKIIPDGRKAAERNDEKGGGSLLLRKSYMSKFTTAISRAEIGRVFEFPGDTIECGCKFD